MNSPAYFWLTIGVMAGMAATIFIARWLRMFAQWTLLVRISVVLVTVVFVGVSLAIYLHVGRPDAVVFNSSNSVATHGGNASMSSAAATAGSMADVTAKLVAKLASGSGSDADWALLQQSYAFLGDTQAAALAAQHQLLNGAAATNTMGAEVAEQRIANNETVKEVAAYQQRVAKNPNDSAAWRGLAEAQRSARNFPESVASFEKLIALKTMDANAWADYADAAASVAGTLSNAKSQVGIDAALQLAPQHAKALWLKASLAHEEKRYADALKLWQQLRAVIPESSPDINIIDANIAEAQSLADTANKLVVAQVDAEAQHISIRGSVDLDVSLKSHAVTNMTLFVYAKASDSPMPIAAYRTTVQSWPVKFVLDDSQVLMSGRKLSQFDQVTLQARLSSSGQALAQSGDLQSAAVLTATDARQAIALRLTQVVP